MSAHFLPTVAAAADAIPIVRYGTVAKFVVPVAAAAADSVARVKVANATTTSIVQTMTVFEILPIAAESMVAAQAIL